MVRAGGRAVDLGGPSVCQGGPKFEIKHKSCCLQKSKLVNWGGSMSIGGARPPLGAGPAPGQGLVNKYSDFLEQESSSLERKQKNWNEI